MSNTNTNDPGEAAVPAKDLKLAQGTSGEAPKVEDRRAVDPCEAKDPGNGQLTSAAPSASGATDQNRAARTAGTETPLRLGAASGADGGQAAVPAGFRLGDGWEVMGDELCCLPCPPGADVHEEGGFFRRSDQAGCCRDCSVAFGALVPIEPPVEEPPGFRVVGRSGPDVPLPSEDTWVRFGRYSSGDAAGSHGFDPPVQIRGLDDVARGRQWDAGCWDILEPIPAAPVAEPAQPVCSPDCGKPKWVAPGAPAIATMHWCSGACGRAGGPLNPPPVPPGPVPPEEGPVGAKTLEDLLLEHVLNIGGTSNLLLAEEAADALAADLRDSFDVRPKQPAPENVHMPDDLRAAAIADGHLPPGPVPPAAAPAKVPLSARLRASVRSNRMDARGEIERHADELEAMESQLATAIRELADEKAAHDMTRDAVKCAVDSENAMRVERDEQRGRAERAEEVAERLRSSELRWKDQWETEASDRRRERDAARAEAEQLRAKLEEAEGSLASAVSALSRTRDALGITDSGTHIVAGALARVAEARRTGWADGAKATRKADVASLTETWVCGYECGHDTCCERRRISRRMERLPLPVCPEGPPAPKGDE